MGRREESGLGIGDPPVLRVLQGAGGTTSQSLIPDRRRRFGVAD
jgi:hypothetical protein